MVFKHLQRLIKTSLQDKKNAQDEEKSVNYLSRNVKYLTLNIS